MLVSDGSRRERAHGKTRLAGGEDSNAQDTNGGIRGRSGESGEHIPVVFAIVKSLFVSDQLPTLTISRRRVAHCPSQHLVFMPFSQGSAAAGLRVPWRMFWLTSYLPAAMEMV